jgi:hypothetical protein
VLPDAEQLVSRYLQDQTDLIALIAARTYTEIPKEPTFPLLTVHRIGGAPVGNRPLYHDRALLQCDAYGGPKKLALTIAETARALLAGDDFTGIHEVDGDPIGIVSAVEFGAFRWLPDADYTPARPRYSFDFAIHSHPAVLAGS